MKLIAGVDEAGRGPVIGPMVMAIVAIDEPTGNTLKRMGVKDSKQIVIQKREKLSRIIKTFPHAIIKVSPKEIDKAVTTDGDSLNELEARTTAKLIRRLVAKCDNITSIIVDLPSKNKEKYIQSIRFVLKDIAKDIPIIAEHKADEHYVVVSAASILAKVSRDKSIATIKKKLQCDIGSGYPADPVTQKIIKTHYDLLVEEQVVRTSWKTVAKEKESRIQQTLTQF